MHRITIKLAPRVIILSVIYFSITAGRVVADDPSGSQSVIWGFDGTPITSNGISTSLPIAGALATFNDGLLQDLALPKYDSTSGSLLGYQNLQGQESTSHFDEHGNFLLAPSLLQSGGGDFFRGLGIHSNSDTPIKIEHFDKYANATELTDYPYISDFIVPILPALNLLPNDKVMQSTAQGARNVGITAGALALTLSGVGVVAGGFSGGGYLGALQAGGLFSAELAGGGVVFTKTQEGINDYFYNPEDPIASQLTSEGVGLIATAPLAGILPQSATRNYLPENFLSSSSISETVQALYQAAGKRNSLSNWYIGHYAGSNNSFLGGIRGLGDLMALLVKGRRNQPTPLLQQHVEPLIDGPQSLFSKISVISEQARAGAGRWNLEYQRAYGRFVQDSASDLTGLPYSIAQMLRSRAKTPGDFEDFALRNFIQNTPGANRGIYVLTTKGQPYFLPGDPKIAKHHSLVSSILDQMNAAARQRHMPTSYELPRIGFAGEYRVHYGGADAASKKLYFSLGLDGSSGSYTALLPIERQAFKLSQVVDIVRGGIAEQGGISSRSRFGGVKLKLFDAFEKGQPEPRWKPVNNSPAQLRSLLDPNP